MKMRIKISLIDYLNKYIEQLNQIQDIKQKLDDGEYNEDCIGNEILNDINGLNIGVEDVGAQIIAGYMDDIAQRAIELNDKKLLELCKGLFLIKEVEDENHNKGVKTNENN